MALNIYLIGYMGSGKSTLGRELGLFMQMPFSDLDDCIEWRENKSIAEIFNQKGESYFRKIESEILKEFNSPSSSVVLATGGGSPIYEDNMEHMLRSGLVVYLRATVEELIEGIRSSGVERPLLQGKAEADLARFIEEHLKERSRIYESAHLILDVRKNEVPENCRLISESYSTRKRAGL
jgi:shikimate kinase